MSSEEVELLSDSKYRHYIAAVEKALKSFDSTSEWADLISALGKLNKALNGPSKFTIIPRKLMIGKRLSQCMHPALPSGVHLKALETYNLIFERIGKKNLAEDLFIYTVGLFPLMGHSAMSVKPVLMKLYEHHFLPLGSSLMPSLPGLVLGLLPGIEEGSDYTERTVSLLESFCMATNKDVFFDALWQSIITTPSVRLPATMFLLSQLDKKLPPCEQQHLLGSNIFFMVQGVCLALNDSLALVQRNVLDFLILLLPLHVPNLPTTYMSTIMTAALGVLLRRDMSLNRRLYAWILGGNGVWQSLVSSNGIQYFDMFGKVLMVDAMKALFRRQNTAGVEAVLKRKIGKKELLKPFRILLNLLDKPEIGSAILEDVLIEVFKNLYFAHHYFIEKEVDNEGHGGRRKDSESENLMDELIKTSNLLFNTFEPYFMWHYIAKLFQTCTRETDIVDDGELVHKTTEGEIKPISTESDIVGDGKMDKTSDGEKYPREMGDERLQLVDLIRLTDYILNIVALESLRETESQHWPQLLSQIILELTKGCEKFTLNQLEEGILLCSKLLSKLTPSTNISEHILCGDIPTPSPTVENFSPEESIEYDSKTFDDTIENDLPQDRLDSLRKLSEKSRDNFEESLDINDSLKLEPSDAIVEVNTTLSREQDRVLPNEQLRDSRESRDSEDEGHELFINESGSKTNNEKGEASGNAHTSESGGIEKRKEGQNAVEGERNKKNSKENKRSKDVESNDDKKLNLTPGMLLKDVKEKEESIADGNNQSILIKQCIEHYEKFIVEFFKSKIFHDSQLMEKLLTDNDGIASCHTKNIPCASHENNTCSSDVDKARTFTAMCKLLVELSCFPMQSSGVSKERDKDHPPIWLRCLLACCHQVADFDIQSTSISTVLDLINLTLSVNPAGLASTGVIVIPILTIEDVVLIEKSDMYKVIASSLWSTLGRPLPIHHRKAVELLIQLHNLTPSPRLCENVIGSSMVASQKESRLEALKRFANLWHIAKSILSQTVQGRTARGLRTFDRSLFVMLDGFESEEPEIRSLTKMWVSHSLEQGDIGRILEPLLLLLLHPSTARVSDFHCEREKKKRQQMKDNQSEHEDKEVQDRTMDINKEHHATFEDNDLDKRHTEKNGEESSTSSQILYSTSNMYKLHYSGKCDYHRILYAFRTLSGILRVVPRQFVCASAATSIGSSFGPYEERIKELLIRHKRSLLGNGFYGPLFYEAGESSMSTGKTSIRPNKSKYLEILITITLYFIRSHYRSSNMTVELLDGNVKIQVSSLECLTNLIWELVKLVREGGHGFGNFITDLLSRCRVQKAIIHCLAATVGNISPEPMVSRASHDGSSTSDQMILQSKLLEVMESLIVLEHALLSTVEALTPDHHGNADFEIIMKAGEEPSPNVEGYTSKFRQGKSLSSQEMLLNMILHCLKAQDDFEVRGRWTGFIVECLPYLGADLKKWVVPVVLQMCTNINDVTRVFQGHASAQMNCLSSMRKQELTFPPDYLLALLAGLTSICHFCLLDAVSSPIFVVQPRAGTSTNAHTLDSPQKPARSMQIFANLLHAFSSNNKSNDPSASHQHPTPLLEAREGLLTILPQVIATLVSVWGVWDLDQTTKSLPSSMALLGTSKTLRQNILQLLTPIAMNHTIVFIASLADVWRSKSVTSKDCEMKSKFFLLVSDDQLRLVSLMLDIKVLSLEVLITSIRQILHQDATSRDDGFEASLLHFFHEYLVRCTSDHITQIKTLFLALIKDTLQMNLPPPAVFFLVVNFHSFSLRIQTKPDRKFRKENQDVAQRLIESCTSLAGLSLGSSAWFSRNLSVIKLPQNNDGDTSANNADDVTVKNDPPVESTRKVESGINSSKHSTQALIVLGDLLASLLDTLFGSEEKERVYNFLVHVMSNVTPYLRNHSVANVPSFRACSTLVASLSGYQYTRKAWRKEMFELFFDANFFKIPLECVGNWRIIIDNLLTQDQGSFRELMARATVTSTPTLNLFGNQETEMRQRALMLRRLSFGVFSSESNQYQSFLPEMQERLAECLRMPQVPVLHEQVFLFFRVLLIRMSDNMTSIWPMIISEMIHVFMLMESDLLQADRPARDQQMFYSEAVLGSSTYVNYSRKKWLGLYLAVCKVLDMALCLPPEQLPQFQMYRWAFESPNSGESNEKESKKETGKVDKPEQETEMPLNEHHNKTMENGKVVSKDNKIEKVSRKVEKSESGKDLLASDKTIVKVFRPYVKRIARLLQKCDTVYESEKVGHHAGEPLLTMHHLESVQELLPFLQMLSNEGRILFDLQTNNQQKQRRLRMENGSNNYFERLIERDFLDALNE